MSRRPSQAWTLVGGKTSPDLTLIVRATSRVNPFVCDKKYAFLRQLPYHTTKNPRLQGVFRCFFQVFWTVVFSSQHLVILPHVHTHIRLLNR